MMNLMPHLRFAAAILVGLVTGLAWSGAALAQRPLYDREPFDRITLNEANENAVLEVVPIQFPGRRVPEAPRGSDKLRVELLTEPGSQYDIAWRDVAKVELFENMLLEQAERLVGEKKFDEAYDYYAALRTKFPQTDRLADSLQNFLFLNAGDYFARQKRAPEALAILEELHRQNRAYKFPNSNQTAVSALSVVAESIISGYLQQENLAAAQQLLSRLGKEYPGLPAVEKLSGQLAAKAAVKRDEARGHRDAGRLREAHLAVREMLEIWPSVEGGPELANEIERLYPLVVVGVSQLSQYHAPGELDNWAARRTGRLRHRLLMEIAGPGPEGGEYRSPVGTVAQSEDRRRLTMQLLQSGSDPVTGYEVARRLLELASPGDPDYHPAWASLVESVRVRDVFGVETALRRPHVLPESLLQVPLDPADFQRPETEPSSGPYVVQERTEELLRFIRNRDYSLGTTHQPAEISEQTFADPKLAIEALRRGEIDIIDRLLPVDALALRGDQRVRVEQYALPSVHVLIPNFKRPYTGNVTFRRALVYGLRRESTLKDFVLGGQDIAGCRVLSGPFPAGVSPDDPLAYAYDATIEPRKYNPRLAATLARLAQFELNEIAKKRQEPPPELQPLVLAHPADFLIRAVCQVLADQLAAVGIKCTLKQLPPGQTRDSSGEYDLLYAELAVWEPLTDAHRLFADDGLAPTDNAYIALALRRMDSATNWRDAGQLLHELHFIAHNEVVMIPLWQLVDHYAYQTRLRALGTANVSLYQDVEQWQVAPRTGQE
ncbi:MAG: hypothetical protein J5I93_10365 [Pirellulaceae bacterium]|nr:hypothetical protein [Pirellulaceae bacterium]